MCTPLAKLAIGLSATMATGFYYLAAAPPGSAAIDVCGPGNYSSACVPDNTASPQSPALVPDPVPTSPASLRDAVPSEPVVTSPAPIVEPVVVPQAVVESPPPVIVEPVVVPQAVETPTPTPTPTPDLIPLLPPPVTLTVTPPTETINQIVPPTPIPTPTPTLPNIYTNAPALRTTTIPEPGTVVALLLTGAGIICSGRKRNKQVGQQR
ncbi:MULTISPECIES: PEP-CTERM sorting domain-containing protein [unclassified Microcoleus]|uniref:PEP-CTERM sorting domain-containing protein n=1 Tax=unclassified Microcoleus TaxID=2642155 RepID=UPI002FD16103